MEERENWLVLATVIRIRTCALTQITHTHAHIRARRVYFRRKM